MSTEIRVGKVSSIDYPSGMIRVVYHDKDNDVTRPIPLFSSEYAMPPVGALVAVVHLSNGAEAGVVLGRPWSAKLTPPEGFEGLYRKDFDLTPGQCYFRYDAAGPESLFHTEGDSAVEIQGSQDTRIKGDRTAAIDGSADTTVKGNAKITVSGKLTLQVGGCTVQIDGSSVEYDLAPGQQMIVDTGNLAMMDATCSLDIQAVKGVKNMIFGGEGVFHTVVTGPGRIVLQTMPISALAGAVASVLPSKS